MKKGSPKLVEEKFENALITVVNPRSIVSEAYRTLRTNLSFTAINRPFRSIMVTSASAKDGKSTIVSNLAVVTAQAGSKVILVDCDLRKPVQHKLFKLPNIIGFTNCILNNAKIEQAVQSVQNLTSSNLKVLTSGPIPPNPAEILNSERTKELWTTLLAKYDYVFIDSPPIIEVADGSILASQVDAVLLVVRQGATPIETARHVKEQLARANAHLMGVVLNRVKTGADQSYPYGS